MMRKNDYNSAMDKIKASVEFKTAVLTTLKNNKAKAASTKRNIFYKPVVIAVSFIVFTIGIISFYPSDQANVPNHPSTAIYIPKIELPNSTADLANRTEDVTNLKMMAVIVYNGKVYVGRLYGDSNYLAIDPKKAEKLIGQKLGTTKDTLDEYSNQEEYNKEFASSIGVQDVYTVKGYDPSFRIMTYMKYEDGTIDSRFFECLNDMTISSGQDVFGKLHLEGNIVSAAYRGYMDWNNNVNNFHTINNTNILQSFIQSLFEAEPYLFDEQLYSTVRQYENNAGGREMILELRDGTKVSLYVMKNGFVRYENLYFQMDSVRFKKMWNLLKL